MSRIKLHDEMVAILTEQGSGSMTFQDIADAVNERGRYEKTERAKTPDVRAFQIRLRARQCPKLFEIDNGSVELRHRVTKAP